MNLLIWALFTAGITFGTWIAIVQVQRHRRVDHERRDRDQIDARLDQLEGAERRIAELEERLDFAERLLTEKRAERLERE